MRVTIIEEDGVVGIDGVFRAVDLSGLYEDVRAVQWNGVSGHVEHYDGANTDLNDISAFQQFIDLWNQAAPPPPPPLTTEQLIALAHARISTAYTVAVRSITAGYPEDEVKSWDKQESEARGWMESNSHPTPWIDAAAQERGLAKAELVSRIIAKATLFTSAHAQLTGKRQRLSDQITALGDSPAQEQLDAIQW